MAPSSPKCKATANSPGRLWEQNIIVREWSDEFSDLPLPASDEAHIWYRTLEAKDGEAANLMQNLSGDEKTRAAKFATERLQSDFVLSRGTLRLLLSTYLTCNPASIEFEYSHFGKPAIKHSDSGLTFNLSHSDRLVLYGFAVGRRIGVDVEKVRNDFEAGRIAKRFFSSAEQAELEKLPAAQRHQAFFRCWSRKEAYIKARGEGLSHPLHRFDVSLAAGDKHALLQTRPDPDEARRWMVCDLPVNQGYAAALAIELAILPSLKSHSSESS